MQAKIGETAPWDQVYEDKYNHIAQMPKGKWIVSIVNKSLAAFIEKGEPTFHFLSAGRIGWFNNIFLPRMVSSIRERISIGNLHSSHMKYEYR